MADLDEMIWQLTDDVTDDPIAPLPRTIGWSVFEATYRRCRAEPALEVGRRFYALVEFLVHDLRGLGRLGREDMENEGEHVTAARLQPPAPRLHASTPASPARRCVRAGLRRSREYHRE